MQFSLDQYLEKVQELELSPLIGHVSEVTGNLIKARNIGLKVGDLCEIYSGTQHYKTMAEVVGFKKDDVYIMPLNSIQGLGPDSRMRKVKAKAELSLSDNLLGRIFDGVMQPLDLGAPAEGAEKKSIYAPAPNPLIRRSIDTPLDVGIKAINGLLTVGKGQRVSILAGSGIGKSMLLGMMARHTRADVNVIGLIGERGREVKEFIERDLGKAGLKKSVIIAATSDQSPLVRIRAAYTATTIAEYFREKGKNVLLLVDSLTRFAMAQREIGLSIGEPPTTKGYPPSVFTKLPQLLERAGNSDSKGSITGFYTVLIDGDDPNDPIGDAVRSIVDGHIILDRQIAANGHYPAIDILNSKSRLMPYIIKKEHAKLAQDLNQVLATYKNAEDIINIGAYVKGSNPKIDYAVVKIDSINKFLQQTIDQKISLEETQKMMHKIISDYNF